MSDQISIWGLQGKARPDEEMVGSEEILGSDEILGMLSSTGAIQSTPAFQAALANRYAKRAPVTQKVNPTKKRRWPVAFGPTGIPPNTTVTITVTPQCLFRGEKLLNSGDATNLFLQTLTVGQKNQLPTNQNAISVSSFGAGVLDNEMLLDTCDPGLSIQLAVQNIGAVTYTFAMTIFGHAVL